MSLSKAISMQTDTQDSGMKLIETHQLPDSRPLAANKLGMLYSTMVFYLSTTQNSTQPQMLLKESLQMEHAMVPNAALDSLTTHLKFQLETTEFQRLITSPTQQFTPALQFQALASLNTHGFFLEHQSLLIHSLLTENRFLKQEYQPTIKISNRLNKAQAANISNENILIQ